MPTEAEYFDAARRSFDDARAQLTETARRIEGYQAALFDPEGPLARMSRTVEHMADQVTALTTKVDGLVHERGKVNRRLKRLEARLAATEERLELLEYEDNDDAPESTPTPAA